VTALNDVAVCSCSPSRGCYHGFDCRAISAAPRGRDIQRWLDALGILDERHDEVPDIARARNLPSPQLVGTPERATLDLNALTARGVTLVGRVVGANGGKLQFSGSLRSHCAMADLKLTRLLGRIDDWIDGKGLQGKALPEGQRPAATKVEDSPRPAATRVEDSPRLGLDLERECFGTVIWATGFRPDHSWLHHAGSIRARASTRRRRSPRECRQRQMPIELSSCQTSYRRVKEPSLKVPTFAACVALCVLPPRDPCEARIPKLQGRASRSL
jgi:hypothetical protein